MTGGEVLDALEAEGWVRVSERRVMSGSTSVRLMNDGGVMVGIAAHEVPAHIALDVARAYRRASSARYA